MQEQVRLTAAAGDRFDKDWRPIALAIVEPYVPVETKEYKAGYEFIFDHYPPDIEEIAARLRMQGFNSSIWINRKFTKKELLAAEYLILGYVGQVNARGRTLTRHKMPVCAHCGFVETVWHYESLQIREQPKGYKLAVVDHNVEVMSRLLIEELWAMDVSGLVAPPVGGEEPADWYGIRSGHILPPVQIPPTRLTFASYRTEDCAPSHSVDRLDSQLFYGRTDFKAMDFNYAYELQGGREHGVRTIVISQRVYHKLVELGIRGLQCEPVGFVE